MEEEGAFLPLPFCYNYCVLQTDDFDFNLDEKLIATHPSEKRDESRLLYYNPSLGIQDLQFKNIINFFSKNDILVRNNTRVLAARYFVTNINESQNPSKIEVFLYNKLSETEFEALAKPGKKLRRYNEWNLLNTTGEASDITIKVKELGNKFIVDFQSSRNYQAALEHCALMPLPPYFKRQADENDKERYQTVYANTGEARSVAAPTAGLHFTPEIFEALKDQGVEILDINLDVGLGTFLPVKTDSIHEHKMHHERYGVEPTVYQKMIEAKKIGKNIVAVGSTSVRVLETIARGAPLEGSTNIFLHPENNEFKLVDAMITNFHLPKSTLIMMVAAFIGLDKVKDIYRHAQEQKYRFYSYGDACFFDLR